MKMGSTQAFRFHLPLTGFFEIEMLDDERCGADWCAKPRELVVLFILLLFLLFVAVGIL